MNNLSISAYIRITIAFSAVVYIMESFIDTKDKSFAFQENLLYALFLIVLLVVLIAIETVWKAIKLLKSLSPEGHFDNTPITLKSLLQTLTKSKPIEAEDQLMLDHDYDGIKELDNALPPWWVWLFYICIFFAVGYMVRFQVFNDYTQLDELDKENQIAALHIEEYKKNNADLIDAESAVFQSDEKTLSEGKEIFTTNCAACHRADGGGGIGPNLTDDNWILGGGMKNIFNTITEGGRPGKGMVAWKGTLTSFEIQAVASYVMSLHGSTPAEAKAAEGDLWQETEQQ
ncbi:cytochrome c oxidase cbb3-type subunit 3 [Myroides marinus]|uniref:Cytochrome c oxidase cbb3-type subunit 3 n=1 Tax=Myroides marinus TaxID=703342 RepID=A0A1H6U698_9FLAO|nr:cbb3-type cytochrome c oxidase N-terminal domain-containing protein [Myroides marinus]SEI87869.1 cytochrome c oxidase cbb3-type subunit 3 [Myroides marinus]